MESTATTMTALTLQKPTRQQFCPECGAIMIEEDRLREEGILFIWFKCSQHYCDGQWLSREESLT